MFCFLQAGVPVDATDHKGLTPLMMACMFGRSLMAAYLLGRGAQANLTDMNGDSALHWSAYKGFPSLMQMLIYSGFDPQKPDNFGSSPLHLACISGNLMAVKLLCAKVKSIALAYCYCDKFPLFYSSYIWSIYFICIVNCRVV